MEFLALQPFVPSGKKFKESKQLFQELGFEMLWDAGGYAGFANGPCKFILQDYDQPGFPENFMLTVNVSNVQEFYEEVLSKQLTEKFGIKIAAPKRQPYGLEVNIIDIAGVCWHFVQAP
jgi:hypothetical protein